VTNSHVRTDPASDRSSDVRSFYARRPYPAPLADLTAHIELYRDHNRRRAWHHLLWPTIRQARAPRILVAGCGTSQGATIALREPQSPVTAIDLSETSLAHLRRLQERHDIRNLIIRQLPLERVEDLHECFDLIVCTGVLHHLPDPDLGLRALREVLRPGGAMHLMVYAAYGRTGVYMLQEYCRILGVRPFDADLVDLGTTIERLPRDHPLAPLVRQAKDFRHPDALADALLNPVDRAFTVPEVYDWLERCGLTFGRWVEQGPYSPKCGVLASLPHASRLAGLPERLQHAAVELFRGTQTQHSFIAYRSDSTESPQPVRFSGDHWRQYVPIRLPWTLCLRDQLPQGFTAVLVNRAHTTADLALPLDDKADQVYRAIDGQRTGEEINARSGIHDATFVRRALENLWLHDQIAVDASNVATPRQNTNGRPHATEMF